MNLLHLRWIAFGLLALQPPGRTLCLLAEVPPVQWLTPGFTVRELPVQLSNQNNLRFAPDGSLTTLGYDGRIWRLRDTDGDGLEDRAESWWDRPTLTVPLGMCWSTAGLFVSSSGKVSLLKDSDGDGRADTEEIVTQDWPAKDVASGNVDATAVTLDAHGQLYFGLLVQNYANAYRLKPRRELLPAETEWLRSKGRWTPPHGPQAEADEFSLYDRSSRRGTIQRLDLRTRQLTTVAEGLRVPVGLAFNRAGDLFNTDQEGETWMPGGNPRDELNHIQVGRHYGFPPPHPRWLPDVVSEPPVVAYGPQHQSACGLVFNEPHVRWPSEPNDPAAGPRRAAAAQGRFGPATWEGEVLVAGESRGKLWSTRLLKTPQGYVGHTRTLARLSLLPLDLAISPSGALYVCCHSGEPDWGTGPQGPGRIFQITYTDPTAPQPEAVWPAGPTEVRIRFQRPLAAAPTGTNALIEFGTYVTAADRLERLTPPYAVVRQQAAAPRGRLPILGSRLTDEGRTLVLTTAPHPLLVPYAVTLWGVRTQGEQAPGAVIDLEYDLTVGATALASGRPEVDANRWAEPLPWAPAALASAGTESRPVDLPDGDWEHGRELFTGKLQCARCHRRHGVGGQAGPDLANLIHRDVTSLLRDIREPDATLHPEYVTYLAEETSGETHLGFLRPAATPDTVTLADADGRETVLPRSGLKGLHPTGKSLMPPGLLEGLPAADVKDLLTFLMWDPPSRLRAEVEKRMAGAAAQRTEAGDAPSRPLRVVLVASAQDHGPGQHAYPDWQAKWQRLLSAAATHTEVTTAQDWPSTEQFDRADVVVCYFWNHDWSAAKYAQLDKFQARGGGLVCLHSAVIADTQPEALAERLGLAAHPGISYRHMPFVLDLKESPLTQGLPASLAFLDEPYWPLDGDPTRVQVLATAEVDGARRPLVWTFERGRGRVFGSILGHYFWTLDDPYYRWLVLRGIAWAGRANPDRLSPLATREAVGF